MKLPLLLTAIATFGLVACSQSPSTDTQSQNPQTAQQADNAPATTQNTNHTDHTSVIRPFLDFHVRMNRLLIISVLREDFPNLTETQKTCLASIESDTNYLSVLEPHFKSILNDDELAQADKFFASSIGQKYQEITLAQMSGMDLPTTMLPNDTESKAIQEALTKPFFTKVKAHATAMSEQQALDFLQKMIDKEVARCNIG